MNSTRLVLFLLLFLIFTSCQSDQGENRRDRGTILLWHGWSETEAVTLTNVLQAFNEIHPTIEVISQAVPAGELLEQYEQTARLGLGPDMFIGPGEWLMPLADAGLILDIRPYEPNTENYFSRAITTVSYGDGLYGLPLSLRPIAMYYNTGLVDTPAATLDEWLAQAANGRSVAMDVNFLPSYWGIQAFGGRMFDETGKVVLDEGGYANWLRWMQSAQSAPGMILSRDHFSLKEFFFSGNAAYFTGSPDDLQAARDALGEDNVAVAPLPAGPVGPSGPLLYVEAIYFNPAARQQHIEMGLTLASFLTNPSQSTTFLREISRIPANRTVPVDSRLHPAEAGFSSQARTSVAVTNAPEMGVIVALGDDLNRAVLAGVVDVLQATEALAAEVNSRFDLSTGVAASDACQLEGLLRLWYPWEGRFATVLDHVIAEYQAFCPDVQVVATEIAPREIDRFYTTFRDGTSGGTLPDMILGSSTWLMPFVEAQSIQPFTSFITPELRQRFLPATLGSVEFGSDLYGIPYMTDLDVLYFNTTMINDPPATLNEFYQLAESNGAAITTSFLQAYWGAVAFGSALFTEEYRLALVESGFVDWLTWLETANLESEILVGADLEQLQQAFFAGEVAMLVAPASSLGDIEAGMPAGNLRVTQLPAGPGGEARPWLRTTSFFLTATLPEEQIELALSFARFATNVVNQSFMLNEARLVPVNVNVSPENLPVTGNSLLGATSAFVPQNVPQLTAVLDLGDRPYEEVLSGRKRPLEAACDFTIQVDRANGFSVAPDDLPPSCR
jgi:arabinogalactan oligomer / maltooligosaccharide transport system substrate-binding protein